VNLLDHGVFRRAFSKRILPGVKAGVVNLTRALALEWAADDIRVNAVAPTYVRTERHRHLLQTRPAGRPSWSSTPLGRLPELEEIAAAILYLCSPPRAVYRDNLADRFGLPGPLTRCATSCLEPSVSRSELRQRSFFRQRSVSSSPRCCGSCRTAAEDDSVRSHRALSILITSIYAALTAGGELNWNAVSSGGGAGIIGMVSW